MVAMSKWLLKKRLEAVHNLVPQAQTVGLRRLTLPILWEGVAVANTHRNRGVVLQTYDLHGMWLLHSEVAFA